MAEGVDPASRNAYADPDGDGLTNWDEFIGKTDPLKPDAVETTHMLTCEVWTDLPGSRIRDLVHDKRFPARPTHATLVDNIDFSAEGDSYGVRLRGYLTAPDDGPYVFYISGSDACVLYLAESEDKFTKHAIAQTSAGTGWRAFGQSHSQESEPVELKQGQKYYVEVLFKRGARQDPANGIDNASVAWRRPGRQGLGQTVINAAYFSPYRPDPRDANDNDLLDSWELAFGLDPKDTSGANGAWSDSDGDWLDNFTEFQLHLDPTVADYQPLPGALLSEMPENFLQLQLPLDPKADFTCLPGFALWESWENIPGDSLAALIASPTFPLAPTQRKWVSSIEGPCGMGKSYGSRLRAWIVPPATGSYTFAISGDNECGLWLSPTERKYDRQRIACVTDHSDYRKWDEQASQVSLPVKLEAGKRYFMEVLHKQGDGADHVSVAWKIPGSAVFRIIRDTALAGYARDPSDLDDNDIPDAWQKAYKIAGSGYQDSDGDGLSNREEYMLGTRPDLVDSDGDGVSDFDEVTFYHSDPNVRDAQPPVVETEIAPDSFTASDTRWFSSGGMLVSFDRRGTTSWNFPLDQPGVYQVVMKARVLSSLSYSIPVPVTLEVDGTPVGSGSVQPGDLASTIRFFTQYLKPGAHLVTLDNRNVRNGISLGVESLEILRNEGADADGNGIPDWLQHIYASVDTLDSPTESPVSPACIEGAARFVGDLSLAADGEPVQARQALAGRWYADVPLRADQAVKLDVSFEGGAVRRALEFRWVPLNLLTCGPSLALRVGDSILCTAYAGEDAGDAQFGLSFDGEEIHAGPAASPFPLTFPKPGTFTLAVETAGGRSEVQVLVVAASFGPDLNVAVGRARTWPLPQVGPDLALECDPGIIIEDTGAQSASPGRCLSVSVRGEESGDFNILARLSAGGPIVASSTVHGFLLAPATVTGDSRVVQTLPDGTVVIRVGYVIDGRVPADLSVWLQIFVTNAVFANGDTWYHLTAADFDANGQASLLIYKAPVDGQANMPHYICHRVNAYADAPPGAQVPVAPAAAAPPAPAVPPSDAAPKAP